MKPSRHPDELRVPIQEDLLSILGSPPKGIEIHTLPQDASNRRYYRIKGHGIGGDKIIGESIVLMVLADPDPHQESEEIVSSEGTSRKDSSPREMDLDFVNVLHHLTRLGLPVPRLYLYNLRDGLLYIEDLGGTLLEDAVKEMKPGEVKAIYEKAIDHLITLHIDGTKLCGDGFVGFRRAFDEKLLFYELMHFIEYGIEASKNISVDEGDLEAIKGHFHFISQRLAGEPRILSHRDYQSRNLLLQGDRLRIIDFQDALMGPIQYDLACLLRDSYVGLPGDLVEELLNYYIQKFEHASGESLERDHFREMIDLQTVQRKLKDAGRFDYINLVKGNPKFLQYIPRSLGYVRESFDRLPHLWPLRDSLARYVPQLKG